jgi:hypothetical protein
MFKTMSWTADESPDLELVNFYSDLGAKSIGLIFSVAKGTLLSKDIWNILAKLVLRVQQ